ncbi:SOUL family heme-binding protein [Undibacterium sp. Ren11W]|uniref:SOUL family heme-binding protein n=1 Tax=Undibacterium sp. Ren11W TaxID=3413045 RepID=UPI003BF0A70A
MRMNFHDRQERQIEPIPRFWIWLWFALPSLFLVSFSMDSQATDEPDFKIVQRIKDIEIRDYATYAVAEVVVEGPADQAGNVAFPILAGYIFGNNKGARKLKMTAPVTQADAPTKLEMSAPVTQTQSSGGFVVQFVLPKDVTLASAPEPLDQRVKLREVSPARLAVIRYSGFWSDNNYNKHLSLLKAALESANLKWEGEAVYSRYDPPFMPWFLRRNEIWLHVAQ